MAAHTLRLTAWGARRLPDEDIFDRASRGDPVAFSEVYRRYQKRIYGYCLARSLDPETAADATQEVFMKLLRAESGSIASPKAWLFTVARNAVVDVIRKRSHTPEDSGIEENSQAWDRLKSADTADEVLTRADARNVFLALRTVRPRYRTALVMREIHGQSAKDMAEAFETSPGAVDTLVSRARDAFGVAYATVSHLPSACRTNVELIYRKLGTGITQQEESALQAHLASCERCRTELKRAHSPRNLAALLPFLVPVKGFVHGLLGRAALTNRMFPDAVAQQNAPILSQPQTWNLGTKIAASVAAAAIITAPIAATTIKRPASQIVKSAHAGTVKGSSSHRSSDSWALEHSMDHNAEYSSVWSDGKSHTVDWDSPHSMDSQMDSVMSDHTMQGSDSSAHPPLSPTTSTSTYRATSDSAIGSLEHKTESVGSASAESSNSHPAMESDMDGS